MIYLLALFIILGLWIWWMKCIDLMEVQASQLFLAVTHNNNLSVKESQAMLKEQFEVSTYKHIWYVFTFRDWRKLYPKSGKLL